MPLPELDSTALMVASKIIGYECADVNEAFLECKSKDKNPRECLGAGEQVTACVLGVMRELESKCGDSFNNYKKAMDDRWHEVSECRKEEEALKACWTKDA